MMSEVIHDGGLKLCFCFVFLASGDTHNNNKSEISQVYEVANFNGLNLEFKVSQVNLMLKRKKRILLYLKVTMRICSRSVCLSVRMFILIPTTIVVKSSNMQL